MPSLVRHSCPASPRAGMIVIIVTLGRAVALVAAVAVRRFGGCDRALPVAVPLVTRGHERPVNNRTMGIDSRGVTSQRDGETAVR